MQQIIAANAPTSPHAIKLDAKIYEKDSVNKGRILKYIVLAMMPNINPIRPIANNVRAAFSLLPIVHHQRIIHFGRLSPSASADFDATSSGNFSLIFSSAMSAASSSIF